MKRKIVGFLVLLVIMVAVVYWPSSIIYKNMSTLHKVEDIKVLTEDYCKNKIFVIVSEPIDIPDSDMKILQIRRDDGFVLPALISPNQNFLVGQKVLVKSLDFYLNNPNQKTCFFFLVEEETEYYSSTTK